MTEPVTVWMLRYNEDDNCDGDPVSVHATKDGAEAEAAKFGSHVHVEPWPLMP